MLKQNLFKVVIFVGLLICAGMIISCDNQEELANSVKVKTEKNPDKIATDLIKTFKLAKEVYAENKEYDNFAEQMQTKLPKDNFFANRGIQTRSGETQQVKNALPESLVLLIKENWLDKDFDKLHKVVDEYYLSDEFKNFSEEKQAQIKFVVEVFEKSRFDFVKLVTSSDEGIKTRNPGDRMIWSQAVDNLDTQEKREACGNAMMGVIALTAAATPIGAAVGTATTVIGVVYNFFEMFA